MGTLGHVTDGEVGLAFPGFWKPPKLGHFPLSQPKEERGSYSLGEQELVASPSTTPPCWLGSRGPRRGRSVYRSQLCSLGRSVLACE